MRCGACQTEGHRRSSKACPLYGQQQKAEIAAAADGNDQQSRQLRSSKPRIAADDVATTKQRPPVDDVGKSEEEEEEKSGNSRDDQQAKNVRRQPAPDRSRPKGAGRSRRKAISPTTVEPAGASEQKNDVVAAAETADIVAVKADKKKPAICAACQGVGHRQKTSKKCALYEPPKATEKQQKNDDDGDAKKKTAASSATAAGNLKEDPPVTAAAAKTTPSGSKVKPVIASKAAKTQLPVLKKKKTAKELRIQREKREAFFRDRAYRREMAAMEAMSLSELAGSDGEEGGFVGANGVYLTKGFLRM